VVGTGIQLAGQLTPEARAAIVSADEVLYLVGDIVALRSLELLNSRARSLQQLYEPGRIRAETYAAIVEEILAVVRRGRNVCVALYGHPGVFAQPAHDALRQRRAEGTDPRRLAAAPS